jgi:uncharacterized protein (DUF983 family)
MQKEKIISNCSTPSPYRVGLRGNCPQCGQASMFRSYVALRDTCPVCGLDYEFADGGDGPAVFVILIAGCLGLAATLWVEFTYSPPMWLHLVVSLPVILILCLGLLRPLKGLLIALQFHNNASEGRHQ